MGVTWRRRAWWASLLVVVLPAVIPRQVAAAAETEEIDPVVLDVIEMLGAGVEEGIIIRWLDATGRRPLDVSRQGVIGLSEAGASEELVQTLIDRVVFEAEESLAVAQEPSELATRAEESRPAAGTRAAIGERLGRSEAVFRLGARQIWTDEDEPDSPRQRRWNVYLYLNGEFLAWTTPSLQGDPVEVRRSLEARRHEMRVILQRHDQVGEGWSYESLVIPTLMAFEIGEDEPVEIEVDLERIWGLWRKNEGGPLSYRIQQGSQALIEVDGTGGNPDRWVSVCEDVEANFAGSAEVPRRFRSAMSRCSRWGELWTGAGRSTSRPEILTWLAEARFEPPLR